MRNQLIAFLCTVCGLCWGQHSDAEKYLKTLSEDYKAHNTQLVEATKILDELKSKVIPTNSDPTVLNEVGEQMQKTRQIQIKLDSINDAAQAAMKHYVIKEKLVLKDLKTFFPHEHEKSTENPVKNIDTKLISYFGEGQTIDHDILIGKSIKEIEIIKNALSTEDKEHYLGDITIPKKGEEFYFYKYYTRRRISFIKKIDSSKSKSTPKFKQLLDRNQIDTLSQEYKRIVEKRNKRNDYILTDKSFRFNKISVEVRDGYFHDIVAHVDDDQGNTHIFTNQIGLSVLFFSNYGDTRFMYYLYSEKKNSRGRYSDAELSNLYIKLTDIFAYTYEVGNHYIPMELKLKLPDDIKDNKYSNVKYKILQKTTLEKIVELRAYSDFLALFGDADNGLVQIDGKATFYLFPYPFRILKSERVLGQIEFLPTLSPYANYSRFEDKSRFVSTHTDPSLGITIPQSLSLIEKRFLTMGVEGEIFKWQHKSAPVKLSLFGFVNYNISEINLGTEEDREAVQLKAMGHGFGLHLGTKRFNNFGFDYKAELSWFNYDNFNTYEDIKTDFVVPVFKHQAEVFYHPNGNVNSAIFVRLVTHNYTGPCVDEAFYQFQFGYKFAIGNRAVSK